MTLRSLALLLALALLLGLAACDLSSLMPGGTGGASDGDFTPTVYTEVTKDTFESTYADQLSPNERAIYDAVAALPAGTTSVDITFPEVPALCRGRNPSDEEMNLLKADISRFAANALYAAWLDFPTLFWLDHSRYSYNLEVTGDEENVVKLTRLTLNLSLTASADEIKSQTEALARAVSDFLPLGKTPAEKIAYINTYLTARIEYDLDAPHRASVIGALVDGKCVCEGYARAFDYLCAMAGIDAVCIPGYGITKDTPEGEGHMWNAVALDGKFYAADVTWNDTTGENAYLLVGADTVCHDTAFGASHKPAMLTKEGPHKPFAFPAISPLGYGINP